MKPCLDDATLVRLVYGEATARQRRHLGACAQCAERRAAIARARDVASAVLGGAAIRPIAGLPFGGRGAATSARRGARVVAPLAIGAALAATLVLAVRPATRPQPRSATVAAELSFDDVARAFAVDDVVDDDASWLRADADDVQWQAALGGERACDVDDGFGDSDCS